MEAPCQACGGNGWSVLLVTCSKCHVAHEHSYCMQEHSYVVPREWVCVDCSIKPVQTDSSSYLPCVKAGGESSKVVPWRKVIPEKPRVRFISLEEVKQLSSRATGKGFPSSNVGKIYLQADSPVGFEAKGLLSATGILKLNPCSLQIKIGEPLRLETQQISLKAPKRLEAGFSSCPGSRKDAIVVNCIGEWSGGQENQSVAEAAKEIGNSFDDTNAKDTVLHSCKGNNNYSSDAQEGCSMYLLRQLVQYCQPFLPALHPIWKGAFLNLAKPDGFYGGLRAQPPSIVHQKAYKYSKTLPLVLLVEQLPVGSFLEDLFQNENPNLSHVALYFFPDENLERSKEQYTRLFDNMVTCNAMIRSKIDGADLLIFTSKPLDETTQEIMEMQINTRNFLWGLFLRTSNNNSSSPPAAGGVSKRRIVQECPAAATPPLPDNAGVCIRIPNHRVRLNVQGISNPGSGIAGAVGIIRDASGTWICGYILHLSSTPVALSAELLGLYKGLTILWERGFRKVLVETTNTAALKAVTTGSGNAVNSVVKRCRELIQSNWECRISAISKEQNACAIWLAERLEVIPAGLVLLDDPPPGLIALMENDREASPSYDTCQE